MHHPQGPSNNPYPEPCQPNLSYVTSILMSSHLGLGFRRSLFKTLKALLLSSILATCPAHLILQDLITLPTLGERANTMQYCITNSMTNEIRKFNASSTRALQ
jgi:hypothetical protein